MKTNHVARAIDRLGGPGPTSWACKCTSAAVYQWRKAGIMRQAKSAVLLSHASGVPIELLVGLPELHREERRRARDRRRVA